MSPSAQKHFLESFTDYLESIVVQATDRDNKYLRTVEEYFETRRHNIGTTPTFAIGEAHLNLPDEAFYHPIIKKLELLTADMIILDNVGPNAREPLSQIGRAHV